MELCDLGPGFGLVPLRETRGYHPTRNERKLWSSKRRCQWIRRNVGKSVLPWVEPYADPMEVQAKLLLRAVMDDLREHADWMDWDLRHA